MSDQASPRTDRARVATPARHRPLARYIGIGFLSYIVDAGILVIVSGPLGGPVWLATTLGFWTSVFLNFALNRRVFAHDSHVRRLTRQGVRYGILLGVNYVITLAIVGVGTRWGLAPVVPKTLVVGMSTGWNFILYRRWVFR